MTYTHKRTPTEQHTEYIQQHKHKIEWHTHMKEHWQSNTKSTHNNTNTTCRRTRLHFFLNTVLLCRHIMYALNINKRCWEHDGKMTDWKDSHPKAQSLTLWLASSRRFSAFIRLMFASCTMLFASCNVTAQPFVRTKSLSALGPANYHTTVLTQHHQGSQLKPFTCTLTTFLPNMFNTPLICDNHLKCVWIM